MAPAQMLVLERGYRGCAETLFADLVNQCRGFHDQLGDTDLLLRGSAVSFAVAAEPTAALRIGRHHLTATPDPRRGLESLISERGLRVRVDVDDLRRCGFTTEALLPAAVPIRFADAVRSWPDYERVWFL